MRRVIGALKRCDLAGCELGAHFILKDGRYICDKHAYFFGVGAKVAEGIAEEMRKEEVDFLEDLEEGRYAPGDEVNGQPPRE